MRRAPLRTAALFVTLLALGTLPRVASADADELRLPRGDKIVIDGRGADRAWEGAIELGAAEVEVPVPGSDETRPLRPRVRLTESEGRLCVLVEAKEDPGPGMGVVVMLAHPEAETAADAISVAYRPQSLRQLQYVCRGPAGVGRTAYPCEGAAVAVESGAWSLELAIGLDALRPRDAEAPLRVAALVLTRSPNLTSAAPAAAAFKGPETWAVVRPPAGGFGSGARFDMDVLNKEDADDLQRLAAWNAFMTSNAQMAKMPPGGGTEKQVRAFLDEQLLSHLAKVRRLRPDLGAGVDMMEADIYRQLGLADEARERYERVIRHAPGLREARYGRAFLVDLVAWTGAAPSEPTRYEQAIEHVLAVERDEASDAFQRDAAAAAHGILLYKSGSFAEAVKRLEPLARRYPMHRVLNMALEHARETVLPWANELQRRRRDERDKLPRVRLVTSRGEIEVELFQNDAANAVNNFIWLARKGFFDGLAWHGNVPYLMAQSGDPFSKDDARPELVGLGGPGYAIRAQANERLPFRGAVAMIQTGAGTAGSQFGVLTGAAIHAKDRLLVFGRVIAGQNVADRLVLGDRIEKVEILRVTEGWDYTPRNVAQEAPTEPKPTAAPAPGGR